MGFAGAGVHNVELELRTADDPAFQEFDPKAMHVLLVEWGT